VIPSDHFYIGGGATATAITVVAAVLLLVTVVSMFALPRRYVLVPLLLGVFLVPSGNVLVVGGLHLMPGRLLALVGWVRVAWARPPKGGARFAGGCNAIDIAFLGWGIATAVAVTIQWMSMPALINQCGALGGNLGMYFLLRQLIRGTEDIARAIKVLVVVAAIVALGMVCERLTLRNFFGIVVGGVQEAPLVREGRVRSQGPFQHAILAGVFGATLVPPCLWLWKKHRSRWLAGLGLLSGTVMTLTAASSTPVMAYAGGVLSLFLWPIRRKMRALRWGIGLTLTVLHLAMKAPVWFLIARVDVVGGSASFDRAYLIDTCVRHFSDWWLCGTHDMANWGWSMWDQSNQFVAVADGGGLLALAFFIGIVSRCFGGVGTARRDAGSGREEVCMWILGAAVFAHVMAFFGVSYFDQTVVAWFVLLAIISVATLPLEVQSSGTARLATYPCGASAAAEEVDYAELGQTDSGSVQFSA
jgi:hypothetical protein